ncbi:AAA-ATPase [Vitis vinifera]|uniref:AAA-ATPase n=1 Tax=Vitis vinifera TaxID=29760 RepID=A0A438EG48_VITVI|nr:AAA-ATPase [Vitis vinifera]
MDKHIELSYCCFEAFKVLAKNYLDLDSHHLFASIRRLLEETNMTPADVAENLMPKSISTDDPGTACLENLIQALETAKEEARVKAEKEAKEKEEEEERLKGEKEGKEKEATAGEVKEKEMSGEKRKERESGVAVKENGVV